jgi:hypothetical protein
MAWLGGTQRFMEPGAQIGLHSAYSATSRQGAGVANALLGAYLNRVGLPYSAVVYMTQSAPQSITWLSIADAKRLGIEVNPLDSAAKADAQPAVASPTPMVPSQWQVP